MIQKSALRIVIHKINKSDSIQRLPTTQNAVWNIGV